jgi:putative transposase
LPEIFNAAQVSQFALQAVTETMLDGVNLPMDGCVALSDNVFLVRLWRSVMCEKFYLKV